MPSQHQSDSLSPLLAAIAVGGLIAGSLDILVASAINAVSPAIILQAIASGLLGRASYDGGTGTMALGLVLQWLMSLIIAAVYGAPACECPRSPTGPSASAPSMAWAFSSSWASSSCPCRPPIRSRSPRLAASF
jgi:hypothetical protein